MNKIYTSALAGVLIAGSAMAQSKAVNPSSIPVAQRVAPRIDHPNYQPLVGARGAEIWSSDFSNATDWTIAHNGVFAGDWQIGQNLSSQGDFPTPAIESTTAGNGYAMYDSDGLGNTGSDYEQPHMTSPVINLSTYTNVIVQFENQYRKYIDEQTFLVVSTDGTWPDADLSDPLVDVTTLTGVYQVWGADELTQGVSPGNPTLRQFNVSSVAGGQANVQFRIQFTGIYGYTWYVDDFKVIEQPPFEISMQSSYFSHTGGGEEYGRTPASQLNPTMLIGGVVENIGINAQTNVAVTATVSGPVPFTVPLSQATIASGEISPIETDFTLPALTLGLYTASTVVSTSEIANDAFPDNNTDLRNFEITDNLYSLDGIGNHPEGDEILASIGTNSFANNEDGMLLFTYYPIASEFVATGIEVALANGTLPDGTALISIHDTTDVLADIADNPIAVSSEYVITQADVDAGSFRVCFDNPVVLPTGGYYAGLELYSNGGLNTVRILDDVTVPQPSLSSVMFLPVATQPGGATGTFTNGTALAIRLSGAADFCVVGMDEEVLSGISLYPNPSNGQITLNAATAAKHIVEVVNALGEVVATSNFNLNLNMDLSNLAKGVYSVRVSTDKASFVQRVTLN
ncbi:MAG: T9SS type A sorting domain-containing protein [Flavobacteriales bacterium]|nr:T9SS type A sorting domain-containing protein [Flavobacteriales bacterium]